MRLLRHALPALALAASLTACSSASSDGPTTAMLQEDLDAQATAQASLRDRIAELEDRLDTRLEADGTGVSQLEDRISELDTKLGELTTALDQELTAREDATAETLASLSALEGEITAVKESLDGLRTELAKLQEDHELLKRRFENHGH